MLAAIIGNRHFYADTQVLDTVQLQQRRNYSQQ